MSTFEVKIHTLEVSPHPNADRLDLVTPRGTLYRAISQKGRFQTGDLAVYVPEGAVVPERVLRAAGFFDEEKQKGMLAGPRGDRVKAIRLRGELSQGIFIDLPTFYQLLEESKNLDPPKNLNWASALGITKYQAPIPVEMSGEVDQVDGLKTYTNIENFKNHPDVFQPGESVIATEKLHGTCSIFSLIQNEYGFFDFHVSSKGLAGKGLGLKESETNLYWRTAREYKIEEFLRSLGKSWSYSDANELTLFGEILGVQDLMYGFDKGDLGFRAFDIRVNGRYLDSWEFNQTIHSSWGYTEVRIPVVPTLYHGEFDQDKLWALASGKTTISKEDPHIREGIVIRSSYERQGPGLNRVVLKMVSEDYLVRKHGTELE